MEPLAHRWLNHSNFSLAQCPKDVGAPSGDPPGDPSTPQTALKMHQTGTKIAGSKDVETIMTTDLRAEVDKPDFQG